MTQQVLRTALVMYSAEQMFDLVNDIEAYPEFMDGCVGATILKRDEHQLEAQLELSKGGVRQQFITRNELRPPLEMTMHLVDGPFKKFEGSWRFEPLSESACKIIFELDYAFSNRLLALAANKMFETVANRQVDALCRRAEQVYGSAS